MNKKLIWLSSFAFALFIGQSTFATSSEASDKSKHCSCHHHPFQKLAYKLKLTDDQKAKIKAIRTQANSNMKANYQQLQTIRHQMNALVSTDKVDESKLDALITQRNQIKGTMIKNQMMIRNKVYNILTPEQKVQYQAMQQKWAGKHKE